MAANAWAQGFQSIALPIARKRIRGQDFVFGLRILIVARIIALLILMICFGVQSARAGQIEYPQVIHTQYEAVDQKTGGHFVL
ncbi:hypothetical protein ML401_06735 [Bradyrhizobium sp. 62B]|uniref:hypothetical protein n=1 Tax=Bradyrhizobium sp. 62B TaxID=2898442 RepID=UPI002557D7AC|nr:hypothetical protein ML401_06735 [Bradyrhizobium sp. 62B]